MVNFSCTQRQKHALIAVISTVLQKKGNKSYHLRSLSMVVVLNEMHYGQCSSEKCAHVKRKYYVKRDSSAYTV